MLLEVFLFCFYWEYVKELYVFVFLTSYGFLLTAFEYLILSNNSLASRYKK